jgi:hypothetical protein
MVSLRSVLFAATTALVSVVSADYIVDPNSVPLTTRRRWCQDQTSTCPILCQQVPPGTTLVNECDPKVLRYGCLCGNNQQPNMSEYTLTLPYWTCTEWVNQCQQDCGAHNNDCWAGCAQDHPCGATNPTRVNYTTVTSSTASPTASSTDDQIFSGPASGGGRTDEGAAPSMELGSRFGLGVVVGSLLLGFGMMI